MTITYITPTEIELICDYCGTPFTTTPDLYYNDPAYLNFCDGDCYYLYLAEDREYADPYPHY